MFDNYLKGHAKEKEAEDLRKVSTTGIQHEPWERMRSVGIRYLLGDMEPEVRPLVEEALRSSPSLVDFRKSIEGAAKTASEEKAAAARAAILRNKLSTYSGERSRRSGIRREST